MLVRRVCSGTRFSRYYSVRAIFASFRRSLILILIFLAFRRIAFCIVRFIVRRNITRRFSWEVMLLVISFAFSLGLRISAMLICVGTLAMFVTILRSFFTFLFFLSITIFGRVVWMVIRMFLVGRSITIRDTDVLVSFLVRYWRILKSLFRLLANFLVFVN